MPNNGTRRSRLAAAKAARVAAGVNMFSPVVTVKSVEPSSSPLGAEAAYGTAKLRPANQFTGVPFAGTLPPAERRQLQMVRLSAPTLESGLDQNALNQIAEIAAENEANTQATKSASSPNNEADENIAEQLGQLDPSSTKSLNTDHRFAEIYFYRKEILNPIPEGWHSATNASGRKYYYKADGSSPQWERPTLPPGWRSIMSKTLGRPFYHSDDGITQWEYPTSSSITLPSGWYSAKNTSGATYYYSDTGITQWEHPSSSTGGRSRRKHKHRNKRTRKH
jgi:hypothetical protein